MSLCLVVTLLLFGLSIADKSVPSVEFSDSADSEIEFGKNVADVFGGSHPNDVTAVSDDEKYLRNFKSLHNATDLQALASDNHQSSENIDSPNADAAASRADTGTRVLRGTHSDLNGVPTLEHPLFTPYKHNKIDTADFSDCALQGEWKPIGVPSHHYTHHAEDHQKEHFHNTAEGIEAFPSIAAPNTHSPLDNEGLAFWNQFIKESHGNPNFHHHDKHHKKQNHHHNRGQQHSHHRQHNHQNVKHHSYPPHPPQHNSQDIDVFQNIRKPGGGDVNFKIQEKPTYGEELPIQQSLVSNQPSFSDLEFALLQENTNGGGGQGLEEGTTHHSNHAPNHPPHQHHSSHHHNEDFLSPPPAPHRFHHHKSPPQERPKLPHPRPKYVHKHQHHKTQHRVKGPAPYRPPPPVIESSDEPIRGDQHHPHQTPAESSTFTCGHNHAAGTNYHTASYQVEGESDPSLLDDEVVGSNHLTAPIIVGQPSFSYGLDDGLFNVHQRFPKQHGEELLDLEEEGTETGDDNEEIKKDFQKLSPFVQHFTQQTNSPETSTQANSLETTAPQIFHVESQPTQINHDKQGRPAKAFYHDKSKANFDIGFDHSGFSEVSVNSFQPHTHLKEIGGGERLNVHPAGGFPGEHAVSHSEPSGFFSSQFPPFSEAFKNEGFPSKDVERSSLKNVDDKQFFSPQPTSYTDFSFPSFKTNNRGKYQKAPIAVFHHSPAHNKTKTHLQPRKKRPHKPYEVDEKGGEYIPGTQIFPPRKMPKQFDMRTPNIAVPKAKRPKSPPAPKYQSTLHYDGSNMGVYTSHPRNKVTKIRLKPQYNRRGGFTEPGFRKSLTVESRIH